MTRLPLFNSPFLLGFDEVERAFDRVSKGSSEGYPPYNIEQVGDNALRITLAVAGFALEDLTVSVEDRQLTVHGKRPEEGTPRTYLHHGIAARQFQRSFVLAEGIEVTGARLANGLLHIDLSRPQAEPRRQTVEIRGAEDKRSRPTIDVTADKARA